MRKEKNIRSAKKARILAALFGVLVILALLFSFTACGRNRLFDKLRGQSSVDRTTDTDGDGIPDYKDEEPDDNLDGDNVVNVGDLIPKE